MKKITKFIFYTAIALTIVSCSDDNLFKDAKMTPTDSTRITMSSKLNIRYDYESKMFMVNTQSSEFKEFVYSEDSESKNTFFLNAYQQGFKPLTVYGGLQEQEQTFEELIERFEETKERESLQIMNFSELISPEESIEIEENGLDLDTSTFIGDNDFASLLNYNGQIQINDSVYTYTPKGLFVVKRENLNRLTNILQDNPSITISEGYTMLGGGTILGYKPSMTNFEKYKVDIHQENTFHSPPAPSTTYPFQLPNYTGHYSTCATLKKPAFPNIFGKSYTCLHRLSNTTRMKSIFRVQDFLFFNHTILKATHQREKEQYIKIKIWPFKIKWKVTKYWQNASADKLYSKINLAYFDVKRKNNTLTVSNADIKSLFQKISNLIYPINSPSQSSAMYVVNDEFILNATGNNYSRKNFVLKNSDINHYTNYTSSVIFPTTYESNPNTPLPDLNFLANSKKKVIINVMIYNHNIILTTDDILKMTKKVIEHYVDLGHNKDDIAVIMNEINLKNLSSGQISAPSSKIVISGEVLTKQGTHKIERKYEVDKDFKLEELTFSFSKSDSNFPTLKLNLTFSSNSVDSYFIDFETGIFSNGAWGGVKYSISN